MMVVRKVLGAAALVAATGLTLPAAYAQVYWRLDTGGSFSHGADLHDKNFATDRITCGDPGCTSAGRIDDVGRSPILGAGVGLRLGSRFRTDATVTYRGGYTIDESMPDGTRLRGDVGSTSIMINGYYDWHLGWGTPYMGIGLGWASNKIDKLRPVRSGFTYDLPNGTKANLAWSVATGVGFVLHPGILLDVGYRYISLGKMETDFGNVTFGATPLATYEGVRGHLQAHELTLGLRF